MSDLSAFTPEEKDLLIGVFFRTGRWVSSVDETGDYTAEVAEEKELLTRLGRLKREIKDSGIIGEIGSEAARRHGDWKDGNLDAEEILCDVQQAGKLISMRLGEDALSAYKTALMQIATEIARAYREEEANGHDVAGADTVFAHVRQFFAGAIDRFVTKNLNISGREADALERLSTTLKNIE